MYNDRDQLLTETTGGQTTTYAYDGNGSLTSKSGPGGTDTFEYDLRNRMVAAEVNGVELEYVYDHHGERVSRTVDSAASEHYLFDRMNPTGYSQVLEKSSTQGGSPDQGFVIGHRAITQADGSTMRHLLHDGHGSVRAILDATGAVATGQIYAYDAN